MLIPRLRKPRWAHGNAEVRLKAVESGGVPGSELLAIVRGDPDERVRRAALARVDDLCVLEGLLAELDPEPLRAAIRQRLIELLNADPECRPVLSERLYLVRRLTDPVLAEALARRARSHELRRMALECVNRDEVLAEVAVNDPVAAVRRAAVERITDPAFWDQVSRQARKKDKQIARTARGFLEAQRRVEAQRETVAQLVMSMERLAGDSADVRTQGRSRQLKASWEPLTEIASAEQTARFQAAVDQVDAHLAAYESQAMERRRICEALEACLDRPGTADEEEVGRVLGDARARWAALGEPGEAAEAPMEGRFRALEGRLERHIQALGAQRAIVADARAVIERARTLADSGWDHDPRRIQALEKAWRRLDSRPEREREDLQRAFEEAIRTLKRQVAQDREHKATAVGEVPALLDQLSQALAAGELHQAVSLRDKARHRLRISRGVQDEDRRRLQQRLSGIQADLDELLRWRRWGSQEARAHLIQEAESLTGSPLPAEDIAARVRVIRREWRRIDRDEGPAAEALWDRFDKACGAAYTPFRSQQQERSRQREHHLDLKRALCEELDALEQGTDWKAVDWRVLDEQLRKMRSRWRRIGPVLNAERRAVEQRFEALVDRLEVYLDKERRRELHRRRALIGRVEALAGAEDLRKAIDEVKEIQQLWRPTVQASRKEEQALWTEFRSACDKVFERRREVQEAGTRERQAHLDQAQELLDGLAALTAEPEAELGRIRQRIKDAGLEWKALGPLPKSHREGLERRFVDLKAQLEGRVQEAESARAEGALAALEARAGLCSRVERQALDQTPGEVPRAEWAGMAHLEGADAAVLERRFERACAALEGDAGALAEIRGGEAQALETRLRLCLEAEILAGIDSPPEHAQARMALQVSRLGNALRGQGGAGRPHTDAMGLRREWALAGPVRAEDAGELMTRFARALEAMAP